MENRNTRGSEWHKWDLHIHTTSSYDYEDKTITDEEFIKTLADKNVSAIAITDHHFIDIDKINKLREIGKSYNISVFPGIEFLSDARGKEPIHFIGIFSDKANITYIWSQIQAKTNISRIQGERKKINEVYCDLADNTKLIHELGGIVSIHAGKKSNSLENIAHALPHGDAQKNDIARIVDIFEVGLEKDVREYKEKVIPYIEREIGKKHPIILCSDNHNIKNYSVKQSCWIKSDLTFDGLKQIIYEPEDRVYIGADKPEQKNDYQIIDSIKFNNSEMNIQEIKFNQNLNTIIGGRSSGKSILLGCLVASINPKIEPKDEKRYSKYNKHIKDLINGVTVKWRDNSDDQRRIIYYSQSDISEKVRENEYGISGITELVENIVKKEPEKLELITKYETFLTVNKTDINTKINEFCQYKAQIEEINRQIENLGNKAGIESEIKKIQNEIEDIKKGISGYLSPEEDELYKEYKKQLEKHNCSKEICVSDTTQFQLLKDFNLFSPIDSVLSKFSNDSYKRIQNFYTKLQNEVTEQWEKFIEKEIQERSVSIETVNTSIKVITTSDVFINGEKLQEDNIVIKSKNTKLQEEIIKKNNILRLEEEKNKLLSSRDECSKEIFNSFKKYQQEAYKLSQQLFTKRDEVKIQGNSVYIFKDFFEKALKLLNKKNPEVKKYDNYEELENSILENYMEEIYNGIISETYSLVKTNYQQALIDLFSTNYYRIAYDVIYDGDKFSKMSEGKKAFIALRLLLDFDDSLCPIIIDQPEDDLDNRAIYDQLVSYLRKQKKNRQIILATHNPNVVVGADAELVIVANQNGDSSPNQDNTQFEYYANAIEDSFINTSCKSTLLSKGIREHICEILEGGNTAFEIREKKYGYKQ